MRCALVLFCCCLMLVGCRQKPEPVHVRVDQWFPLTHTVDYFRMMQPERPLVIVFYADWDLVGRGMLRALEVPEIFDLFTEHRALPLLANFTDRNGFCGKEFMKNGPDEFRYYYILVVGTSGEKRRLYSHELDFHNLNAGLLSWLRTALEEV